MNKHFMSKQNENAPNNFDNWKFIYVNNLLVSTVMWIDRNTLILEKILK